MIQAVVFLNKISENKKENFVKNNPIILIEYVVIYKIYFYYSYLYRKNTNKNTYR